MVRIREGVTEDIPIIEILAENYREELGCISDHSQWLAERVDRGEVFVADEAERNLVGFVIFHHHRYIEDDHTTISYICTALDYRRRGIGKKLMEAVAADARLYGKKTLILKCPADLPANHFYRSIGCILKEKEVSHGHSVLNFWVLPLA